MDISVVTAVHNGEEYLKETLDSILSQTFKNFEVIIIDDFSTDRTPEILDEYAKKDSRIKIFKNEENLKLARSLNKGVLLAGGKYILRMDADDICLPDRFEKQFEYMEKHPETDVSFCKYFLLQKGEISPCIVGRKYDADSIKAMFLFFCPVLHPGVIAKAEVFKRYEYNPLHTTSEDLDLWTRMLCDGVKFDCEPDYLMLYRRHPSQITAKPSAKNAEEVMKCMRFFYKNTLSEMSEKDADFFIDGIYLQNRFDKDKLLGFYKYLIGANKKTKSFSKKAIINGMSEILAEYRRKQPLSAGEKLSFFRFGAFGLINSFLSRKAQSKKDINNARAEAENAGFILKEERFGIPIYIQGDTNE